MLSRLKRKLFGTHAPTLELPAYPKDDIRYMILHELAQTLAAALQQALPTIRNQYPRATYNGHKGRNHSGLAGRTPFYYPNPHTTIMAETRWVTPSLAAIVHVNHNKYEIFQTCIAYEDTALEATAAIYLNDAWINKTYGVQTANQYARSFGTPGPLPPHRSHDELQEVGRLSHYQLISSTLELEHPAADPEQWCKDWITSLVAELPLT